MAKDQIIENKIIAIRLNNLNDPNFKYTYKLGSLVFAIINRNSCQMFSEQKPYLCSYKFNSYRLKMIDQKKISDQNFSEISDNSKLHIREANNFEIKQLIYNFKSNNDLSILEKHLKETLPYSINKEYMIGEISMLEPSN